MYRRLFILNLLLIWIIRASAALPADSLLGRWDLTIDQNGKQAPSWFEVSLSGNSTLVGSFVGIVGSARPIAKINFHDGHFDFSIPPQWEKGDQDFVIEGSLVSGGVEGKITMSDGRQYNWKGVRAPYLNRNAEIKWGKRINLFNGKDLSGWKATGENQWLVQHGILTSPHSGVNLITEKQFQDFKLHVEFRYQKGSNSGIYLRGRYEVQIEDTDPAMHPDSHYFSGIYGFLTPSVIAALGPNTWQSYDITLIGRKITLVANGKTVICDREIPGITGGALDSREGEAGPIYIQGDHGPIEFRKIVLTPAR